MTATEFCEQLSSRMKAIKKLAESKDIGPEAWDHIDKLSDFVDVICGEIPNLDMWFDELTEELELKDSI